MTPQLSRTIKNAHSLIAVALCTLGTLFPATTAVAWVPPTAVPPDDNVPSPINVGSVMQSKNGTLGVDGLGVFGNTLLSGTNGDGTNNGVNSYLNFGGTAGQSGYGIRDNAGLLEFKNTSGSWATIQSTVFNLIGGGTTWTTSGNDIHNANSGNVGIGTWSPTTKLDVRGGDETLQGIYHSVDMNSGNGTGQQFGAYNWDGVMTVSNFTSGNTWQSNRWTLDASGNEYAAGNITAAGMLQSNSGGVKFPNGTVQTTAAPAVLGHGTVNIRDSANASVHCISISFTPWNGQYTATGNVFYPKGSSWQWAHWSVDFQDMDMPNGTGTICIDTGGAWHGPIGAEYVSYLILGF